MEKNVNISKEISASSAAGEIRQTVLENGLRVITADRPQLETVSLGVWVNTGAANESKADNGISHFIEHMVFKGSKKRNSLQISEDIENVGGRIDGCTSPDFTWFCTQMLKDDLELATDVICDFIANPTFDAAEMEKEKEVVVQEIKRSADAPERVIFNCLKQAAFPHQPLGQTNLGTPENVRAFNQERLLHYMRRHYTADNMVAAAVGRVDHDSFVKMVRERMSALPEHRDFTEVPQCYIGGSRIECRNMEQTHLALGFEGASLLNPDYYRYLVLSAILGRGTASRLFREVREKRGLVYSVFSSNLAFKPAGVFTINAATTPKELNGLLAVVATEIKKLMNDKVSETELRRAKTKIKANQLMSLENSLTTAEITARQILLFGRVIPTAEIVEKIETITADDLQLLAQKIFTSTPSYALLGNNSGNYPAYCDVKELLK